MSIISGVALQDISGVSPSGIRIAVARRESTENDVLFVLDASGALSSFKNTKKDGVLGVSGDASLVMSALEFIVSDDNNIVEIATRGEFLYCRMSSGALAEFDSSLELLSITDNIVRVTEYGTYKDKMKYFKSGPGTESLIPLIEDNILSIHPQNGYDAKVFIDEDDGYKIKVEYGGNIKEADQQRAVAGFVDGAICYVDGDRFSIAYDSGDIPVVDFGYVDVRSPFSIFTRSSCCFSDKSSINDAIKTVLPEKYADYVITNGNIGGCSWRGVGMTGHIVSTCMDSSGFSFKATNPISGVSGRFPYYILDSGDVVIDGVGVAKFSEDRFIEDVVDGGNGIVLNIPEDGRKFFSPVCFCGVTFNFGSDKFIEVDSSDWQSIF